MKPTLTFLALTLCMLTGCAQMGTRQIDENSTIRYEIIPSGETNAIVAETRKTATRAKGVALISGQSTLRGFRARQDGKNQGLEIQRTDQHTDGLAQAKELVGLAKDVFMMMKGFAPSQPSAEQPAALPPPPPGMKWILAPTDDPSTPQPEQ